MYQACLRGRKMFEMENKILNTSHHFLNICFELHVCILYLFFLFFFFCIETSLIFLLLNLFTLQTVWFCNCKELESG